MKKCVSLFIGLLVFITCFSQTDSISTRPAYQRFPTYPPVNLILSDSVTIFAKKDLPKKTPVLVMIFNPACEHCQHETEEIIKHIEEFKDIHIVMVTMMPLAEMKDYIARYELNKYKNITVGWDKTYFLPTFYQISSLPYLALYDKKGNFLTIFSGTSDIQAVLRWFNERG